MYNRALKFRKEFLTKHPELEEQVDDHLQLMFDGVDEGGSIQNETDQFITACEQLLMDSE
ncbi:MAG: hypothetical protein RIR01_2326 [Bacteroidota bacterium]|jgi:hypothetical protein